MTSYLQEIIDRLTDLSKHTTTQLHKDWVQVTMLMFRQHLEALDIKDKYPILVFYCNWNLHIDLDRGIVQNLLENISNVIVDESTGHPADRISEILSFSLLRHEIKEVLRNDAGIESGVFEIDNNWIAFTELMTPFILNKPLKRKREPKTHHWVESLELYDNDGKVFWRIKTSPGDAIFTGPLLRTSN